ncbi:MAG: hypothetical protein DLM50_00145 [Candidatus Meridianibacter frigidus]|nr:MAG: hypothetical protein DLM50_00145 [Candidatus Eremiobacteraeota bacterium]
MKRRNTRYSPNLLSRCRKSAKIGHIRLYDLRHSCASLILKNRVHAKVVSERLGHSTVAINVLPGLQEAATEKLDGLLEAALVAQRMSPDATPVL